MSTSLLIPSIASGMSLFLVKVKVFACKLLKKYALFGSLWVLFAGKVLIIYSLATGSMTTCGG